MRINNWKKFNENRSHYNSDSNIKNKIIEGLKKNGGEMSNGDLLNYACGVSDTDTILSFYETLAELESEGKVKESEDKKSMILNGE